MKTATEIIDELAVKYIGSTYPINQITLEAMQAYADQFYTEAEVIAMMEQLKQDCALNAEVTSLSDDSHYVYEWIVDEQSILSLPVDKYLKPKP